jgi:putative transposase
VAYHRPLLSNREIKGVRLKEAKPGKWYASVVVDHDPEYLNTPL